MPGRDGSRDGSRDDHEPAESVPTQDLSAETQGAFLAMQAASLWQDTMELDEEHPAHDASEREAQPDSLQSRLAWRLLMYMAILLAIAALGVGAVAAARAFLSGDVAVDAAVPAAPVGSPGRAPGPGSSAAAEADAASCVLPDGAATVLVQNVVTQTGKADPAMFVVTWELAVQNASDADVTVSARWSTSGDDVMTEGWTGVGVIVAAGATHLVGSNMVDNNQSGRSGALEWYVADRVLVLRNAPGCSALHVDPSAELEQRALVAQIPALPAGVALPG